MTESKSNPNSVLIIDDNQSIHNDFKKILTNSNQNNGLNQAFSELFGESMNPVEDQLNFELTFASQGREGYEIVKDAMEDDRTFGLAFVDMRMPPGWDGLDTIEKLWTVDPELQIVLCTAYSDHSWEEIVDRLGNTDKLVILKKPFDSIEIIQLVTSLSEKKRLLSEAKQRQQHLQNVVEEQETEMSNIQRDAQCLIDTISPMLEALQSIADSKTSNEQILEVWASLNENMDTSQIQSALSQVKNSKDVKPKV